MVDYVVPGMIDSSAGALSNRNRIINGSFEVWQRGTSRVKVGNGVYLADRWTAGGYQDSGHSRQLANGTAFGLYSKYCLQAGSSTTAEIANGTRITTSQKIESINCYDLAGQTITLSFWVRFSSATATSSTATPFGNWTVYFKFNTTTTDSATHPDVGDISTTVLTLTNGSLPTTWTRYVVSTTVPANTNNISPVFQFQQLGSTASNDGVWYQIAEVQLESGPAATSFERRNFQQELALCQRYFETTYDYGTPPGTNTSGSMQLIYYGTNSGMRYASTFMVPKRVTPTFTVYDSVGNSGSISYYNGSWLNGLTPGAVYGSRTFIVIHNYSSSGNEYSAHWAVSAEL